MNPESWYGSALRWAYQNGITTGVSADTFAPDDCVTREQLVSFLARYAKVTGAYEKVSEDLSSFSDRDRVSSYAVESMQWAVANGLILGTETGQAGAHGYGHPCPACGSGRQILPEHSLISIRNGVLTGGVLPRGEHGASPRA